MRNYCRKKFIIEIRAMVTVQVNWIYYIQGNCQNNKKSHRLEHKLRLFEEENAAAVISAWETLLTLLERRLHLTNINKLDVNII